ncbi:hypothetical protein Bbelb_234640 [Branchiostoma belcheri]|nr:hypothetical protein Bbelb_234640 [Branchiostoma belcheri]
MRTLKRLELFSAATTFNPNIDHDYPPSAPGCKTQSGLPSIAEVLSPGACRPGDIDPSFTNQNALVLHKERDIYKAPQDFSAVQSLQQAGGGSANEVKSTSQVDKASPNGVNRLEARENGAAERLTPAGRGQRKDHPGCAVI